MLLFFRNQQIGDWYVKSVSVDEALTPPARRAGLWQDRAAISAEGRNLLYAQQFFVALKRDTSLALNEAVSMIRELQTLQGDVEVRDGAAVKLSCEDWLLDQVGIANVLEGFGGRFVRSLTLFFIGETPPEFSL